MVSMVIDFQTSLSFSLPACQSGSELSDSSGCTGWGAVEGPLAATVVVASVDVGVSNRLPFSPGIWGVLLPNTGLPSLKSAVGAGLAGGVFAVLDPFPFFLSSVF